MKNDFPSGLAVLRANQGSPVDLQRIQNESLRLALEEVRSVLTEQKILLQKLNHTVDRRTAVLSPAKNFSANIYHNRFESTLPPLQAAFSLSSPTAVSIGTHWDINDDEFLGSVSDLDETGIYVADSAHKDHGDSGLRAFANGSPKASANSRREKTQVDLVLPPTLAFSERSA